MIIKTFEAPTMQEALTMARDALGEEAVVLNTRQVKAGGILGLSGSSKVEVTAAVDDAAPVETRVPVAAAPAAAAPVAARAYAEFANREPASDPEITQLKSDIRELRGIVSALLESAPSKSDPGVPLLCRLGVTEDVVREHLPELASIDRPEDLAAALTEMLRPHCLPPTLEGQRKIAVVGPTGVGKTTTLAKLAARFGLQQGKSVALVTADTYRIGAVDQLRTYARIMGLPLEIAMSPEDVAAAMEKHADKDVVLIDTVGRSQRSSEQIREMKRFVDAASDAECYLVVAASLSTEVQREVVDRFSLFSPTRLVVTKIDESPNRGCIVNIPYWTGIGLACVTAGQNVPQDIEFADPARLARFVTEVA